MKSFNITKRSFLIDGEEKPFLCGELHYFRMPREYWEAALDRLIECGCNAVAYYVPWFVHEYKEGKFDFTGEVHKDNDLHSWIRLTQKKGLLGFIRPGPYVYAETVDLGIPRWFTEKYPNANVKSYKDGEYTSYGFVRNAAHNHPDFITSVKKWYAEVCNEIMDYIAPKGNIVMFQLCNEIPNEDTDDRNPENLGIGDVTGIFPSYLKEKYSTVKNINKYYNAAFDKLEMIEPHMLVEKKPELAQIDHLEFYYGHYYPEYFNTLGKIARDYGINVTLVHNAYNPRAISLHYHNKKKNPWLNIGLDCYYSINGRLGMKEATYFCEFGSEYARRFLDNVPWVAEHECGYWNDYPVVYGPELYIWNIWTLAAGYKGINMYLFASGINRDGMGFFGTDHNWQAPVSCYGEKRGTFDHIKRSLDDIKENSDVFFKDNLYDIAMGIKNAHGLIWSDVARTTSDAYYALKCANFTPYICDFESETLQQLKEHKAIWVVSDQYMDEAVQGKLCDYASTGGILIIQGIVPYKDYRGDPCTLIADELGLKVQPHRDDVCPQQKIVYDGKEYFIGRTVQGFEADNRYVTAYEWVNGQPAAASMPYGTGRVMILPFRIEILFNSMKECITELLRNEGIVSNIRGASMLRVIPKINGRSVVLNLHPETVEEQIEICGREYDVEVKPYSFKIL